MVRSALVGAVSARVVRGRGHLTMVGALVVLVGACGDAQGPSGDLSAHPTGSTGTASVPVVQREAPPRFALPFTEADQRAADALALGQAGRRFVGADGTEAAELRRHALFLAATHTDPDVVAASLRALGDADAAGFAPDERTALRETVRKHLTNSDLAGFAAHAALNAYPDVDSDGLQDALVQVLLTHRNPGVRAASARALVRAPQLKPAAVAALHKASLDPFPGVRLAVAGDGSVADRAAVVGALWPAFRVLLDYHHAAVRAAAVRSVGRALGRGDIDPAIHAEVVAAIRAQLGDRWGRMRCAALAGAGASGDRAFVHDAIERLGDQAACDEQEEYAPAAPDGMWMKYDGTSMAFPRGPTGTVARAAYDAIDVLMGSDLPDTLRDEWEEHGLALPALARITRKWYAMAKASLPPRVAAVVQ